MKTAFDSLSGSEAKDVAKLEPYAADTSTDSAGTGLLVRSEGTFSISLL